MSIIAKAQFYAIVGLGLMVLLGGIFASGYVKGSGDATARCNTAALKDRIAELERDLAAQKIADTYEEFAFEQIRARNEKLEAERQGYDDANAATDGAGACAYTPDHIRRLRTLRGLKG